MTVHNTLTVYKETWTCVNIGAPAAGAVSLYPISGEFFVKPGTDDTTKPTTLSAAFELKPYPGSIINRTIAELWPGSAGRQYLWVYTYSALAQIAVSCA